MKCPKCEEGTLKKIELKTHEITCLLCEFCNTFWEEGESVGQSTGRPFEELDEGDMKEFHITPVTTSDPENAEVEYTKVR